MSEQMDRLYEEAKARGLIEGIHIGEGKAKKSTANNMSRKGEKLEDIADILEVSVEQVKMWIEESAQPQG